MSPRRHRSKEGVKRRQRSKETPKKGGKNQRKHRKSAPKFARQKKSCHQKGAEPIRGQTHFPYYRIEEIGFTKRAQDPHVRLMYNANMLFVLKNNRRIVEVLRKRKITVKHPNYNCTKT